MDSDCTFSVLAENLQYFKLSQGFAKDGIDCSTVAKTLKFKAAGGMRVIISVLPTSNLADSAKDRGFVNSGGNWTFKGDPIGIEPYQFDKLVIKTDTANQDKLLIGDQQQQVNTIQGNKYTVRGESILRISPDFLISTHIAFEPSTPANIIQAAEAELSSIVKGVQKTRP